MSRRPLIGVTTSEVRLARNTKPLAEGDPPQRELALGMAYLSAVEAAGGIPVALPPLSVDAIGPLVQQLDGVCLSGGPDLDPAAYGERPDPELGPTEPDLDRFELDVIRAADRFGLPVLGICRGMQALNVARDGTLVQHLPDVVDGSIDHRQTTSGTRTSHGVDVEPGSLLAGIVQAAHIEANSFHHQAIGRLGRDLNAVAWATDGVIEAVEEGGPRFVLGVQWHAETLTDRPAHHGLFRALVDAATEHTTRERRSSGADEPAAA